MSNIEYSAVNGKGQVVIPADIRDRFDIKQGTKIAFVEEQGRLFLQPVTNAFIESMRGSLAKRGMPAKLERLRDREFA
ncbi:MAG: AbrB/MazE/SpoVT family DNA-binding domain-containing protein [Candidatus Korobacteraceae bacterium]